MYAATLALESRVARRRAALLDEIRGWRARSSPREAAWRATKRADPTVSQAAGGRRGDAPGLGGAHALEKPVQGGSLRPDFALTETFEAFEEERLGRRRPRGRRRGGRAVPLLVAVREEGEGEEDGGGRRRTGGSVTETAGVRGVVLRGGRARGGRRGESAAPLAAREHGAA